MRSHFGLGECPVRFGNNTGRKMRRSANACLPLVNGGLNAFANRLGCIVRHLLSVRRNVSVKPYSRRNAIPNAFECARANKACIGPRHKADVLKAFPFDQVHDVGNVGVQIDVLAQQMRAIRQTGE